MSSMKTRLFLSILLTIVTLSTYTSAQPELFAQGRNLDKTKVKQAVEEVRQSTAAQLAVDVLAQEQLAPLWNKAEGVSEEDRVAIVIPTQTSGISLLFRLTQGNLESAAINKISTNGYPICHYPPGNPENAHTLFVGRPAINTHFERHNDTLGPCRIGKYSDGIEGAYIDLKAGFVVHYLMLPDAKIEIQEASLWQGEGSLEEMMTPIPIIPDWFKKFRQENPELVPPLPEPLEPELESQGRLTTLKDTECGARGAECPTSDPTPPPEQTPPPPPAPAPEPGTPSPNPFEPIPSGGGGGNDGPEEDTCNEGKLRSLRDDRDDAQDELNDADYAKDTARDVADSVYREVVDLRFDLEYISDRIDDIEDDLEDVEKAIDDAKDAMETNLGEFFWDCIASVDPIRCVREEKQNQSLGLDIAELAQEAKDLQRDLKEAKEDYKSAKSDYDSKEGEYKDLKAEYAEAKRVYNGKREAYNDANRKYQNYKDKNCD